MSKLAQTHHFEAALLPQGWVRNVTMAVCDGVIESLECGASPGLAQEHHAVGLPGLPNLHSHAFQRGMAGLAEVRGSPGDSFWTWRKVMYHFLDKLTPDDVRAIAAMAYIEMLEGGFTRVGEFHYLHHDISGAPYANPAAMAEAIAQAASETGIALTLLPVFYAHAGFGGVAPDPAQRRFIHNVYSYLGLREACAGIIAELPDAVLGMAPHSLRAATPEELASLLAHVRGGPVHIHIAEQTLEVDACLAWSGARPVEWLLANAPVGENWCLVHATHMTQAETSMLAQTDAVVGLCPITEANLGDGLFPADTFLAANGRWGIGSDSNVLIDAAEELRWLEYGQRLSLQGRNVFSKGPQASTGAGLLSSALAGGGQALGAKAALQIGEPADFIVLDADHPSLQARSGDALIDGWIFGAGRSATSSVWRHGIRLVASGRHHRREEVVTSYAKVLHRLLA